ncbi:MAG: hypothetical protein DRJ47_03670 [Thermoprotei archaeon]|nr:MAG: hypothetical protein DRJ47_03670 [Thermoprotei archaeon]
MAGGNAFFRVLASTVLALLFTFTLFYSTLILPTMLNNYLRNYFGDPWPYIDEYLRIISSLRVVGYIGFSIALLLIVLGFVLGRSKVSLLGSFTLYLPVFSYFASAMFFLAGIGVLRILWIPLVDVSPGETVFDKIGFGSILMLGDIIYLPYDVLRFLTTLVAGYPLDNFYFITMVFTSCIVFFVASATWLYHRFSGENLVTGGIYKYSRHPQYLAFLVWSYALLVFDKYLTRYPRGGYFSPPPLIWLVFSTTMIAVALREELDMIQKHGDRYLKYREKTPFMIPLPNLISNTITLPLKLAFGHKTPSSTREIAFTLLLYFMILIALSIPYSPTP